MRKLILLAVALVLCVTQASAAASQKDKDWDTFEYLFLNIGTMDGPTLIKCNRLDDLVKMIMSLENIHAAYSRLHKRFPQLAPSIQAQLMEKHKTVCQIDGGCDGRPKPDYCTASKMALLDGTIRMVTQLEMELQAKVAKTSPKSSHAAPQATLSTYDCSNNAQYYQNRYRVSGNASDMVCMQRALDREMATR